MEDHERSLEDCDGAGYALLALIAVRIVWGFVGPVNARFANFIKLLLVLAAAHVAGVIFTSIRQRENPVAAMLHGKKRPLADRGRERSGNPSEGSP